MSRPSEPPRPCVRVRWSCRIPSPCPDQAACATSSSRGPGRVRSASLLLHLLDLDQVANLVDHTAYLRRVRMRPGVPNTLEAQSPNRLLVLTQRADNAL